MVEHPKRMEEEAELVQVSRAVGFMSITVSSIFISIVLNFAFLNKINTHSNNWIVCSKIASF
jgi:hypothetical protein